MAIITATASTTIQYSHYFTLHRHKGILTSTLPPLCHLYYYSHCYKVSAAKCSPRPRLQHPAGQVAGRGKQRDLLPQRRCLSRRSVNRRRKQWSKARTREKCAPLSSGPRVSCRHTLFLAQWKRKKKCSLFPAANWLIQLLFFLVCALFSSLASVVFVRLIVFPCLHSSVQCLRSFGTFLLVWVQIWVCTIASTHVLYIGTDHRHES